MATTTNYGWTTPDDTALVKDGAAAIRTLGSSVDTTTKALNPETTLGDLAYRSSTANVKTRLGLGTAGQVLTVNSGATAPEWATSSSGGMTLLSTTSLSGNKVTISGISGAYNDLLVIVQDATVNTGTGNLRIYPNGSGSFISLGARVSGSSATTTSSIQTNSAVPTSTNKMSFTAYIHLYANSTYTKNWISYGDCDPTSVSTQVIQGGTVNTTSAISSLDIWTGFESGNYNGGRVLIYGVK